MTSPQTHIPARSRVSLFVLAVLTTIVLAGCSGAGSTATLTTTSVVEATPMFASDEEVLAAAEAAYRNYIDVSDQIARDGGKNAERISDYVTTELFEDGRGDFDYYLEGNLHASGSTGMDSFRMQSINHEVGRTEIEAYVCLRLAESRIIDVDQNDVTPASRENNLPLVVRLVTVSPESKFVVSAGEVWTGSNFC